jgi:hypothetical protein
MLVIITGTVWEQIFLNRTYDALETKLAAVMEGVTAEPEDVIDTPANKARIDDLYDYWLKTESTLCYLVKHTETFQISDSILYAKNFIHFNNKEEAMVALTKLQYLFSVRHYNVGTSFQNII